MVSGHPFQDEIVGPGRKVAAHNEKRIESVYSLEFPIAGVEVRRIVIAIVHADHDSVEPRQLRHEEPERVPFALIPQAIDRVIVRTKHPGRFRFHFPRQAHRRT